MEISLLAHILIFTFFEALVSFSSVLFLIFNIDLAKKFSHYLISFAVGVLLGVSFFDVLPEAVKLGRSEFVFSFVVLGIVIFLILENFIHWFHHHRHKTGFTGFVKPSIFLILFGDAIHNFLDGVTITISFLTNPVLGVATSIAVILHEIPQEIGDFSVLLSGGLSFKKALKYNFLVSLTTILGALLTYIFSGFFSGILPIFLAIIGGNFIYIALSDLVPELHEHNVRFFETLSHMFLVILGIGIMAW